MSIDNVLAASKLKNIKKLVQEWANKQGHESCWYYPEIFRAIAEELEIKIDPPSLPPRTEFRKGCERYEGEIYADV